MKVFIIFLLGCSLLSFSQNNKINIYAKLDAKTNSMEINQSITFFNRSNSTLDTLFFHNWANAYKDQDSPLSKRLIENYDKSLYFAKSKKKGFSEILSISERSQPLNWKNHKGLPDIFYIIPNEKLKPGDSIVIDLKYLVKVPSSEFTQYGYFENNYNLRYWYIVPAVFYKKWILMSNLDMDDLFVEPSDFDIQFETPRGFTLHSDLRQQISNKDDHSLHHLKGENRVDVELKIELLNSFGYYCATATEVVTDLPSKNLENQLKTDILDRQLNFISEYLGDYPFDKFFINNITYKKNPVYGFNQLPDKLTPFTDVFEWDIKIFKALTDKFIHNTIITNNRTDYYLPDGIQIFLMMKYVEKYYPEVNAIGDISKLWGIRKYNIAKLKFNGKYPFVYQFATRKNIDQSLTTPLDSLSNFNRKIVNKYKAGLGLRYLDAFVQDSVVPKSIKEFYRNNTLKITEGKELEKLITTKTDKDLSYFFRNYITTNKKIDYTIKSLKKEGDSLLIEIKNLSDFTAPVALYGVKDDQTLFKTWIENVDSSGTVKIKNNGFERVALNYEFLYPENNLRNNWKKVDNALLNRPLKLTFFKDIEDPFYNQLFYNLYIEYNFYDGIVLGPQLYNQAALKKKWLFKLTPVYGFKSNAVSGSFALLYQHLPENSPIYSYNAGISGSNSFYDQDLRFNKLSPFFLIDFTRKSLRDVGGSYFMAKYNIIDKEIPEGQEALPEDKYNILVLRYGYGQPNIINDLQYFADFQYNRDFTKVALDVRYRYLTTKNRQFDFRFFFGKFLRNKTGTDFFSFALDRPSDYLFEYSYLGRSESSGFFSQEVIISDGGFKSNFEEKYANEYMTSFNVSVGIWRWIEMYGDIGLVKNQGLDPYFRYDSGIRFNFVPNFLELYFPLQSSLGFEPSLPDYATKIRFVLTGDPTRIYNFIKRGFY